MASSTLLSMSSTSLQALSSAMIGDYSLLNPAGYTAAFAWGLHENMQVIGVANKLDDVGNLMQSPVVWDQHGIPLCWKRCPVRHIMTTTR